jgi:hypothetical protein
LIHLNCHEDGSGKAMVLAEATLQMRIFEEEISGLFLSLLNWSDEDELASDR